MEDSSVLPIFHSLIERLQSYFVSREESLLTELEETSYQLSVTRALNSLAIEKEQPSILIQAIGDVIRIIIKRREEIALDLRRLHRIKELFLRPSDPLSAPTFTHLDLFNQRTLFLLSISALQQQSTGFEIAVDSA
jgi:hypothetical protein